MTFEEYIANPMGKANAVMSAGAREAQRTIYTRKFDNILLRDNGKIDYYLYKTDGAVYYAHIKVPSEVVKDFYYDVVFKFTGTKSQSPSTIGLDKYQVQFFSNDPAFVYTYAYVFRKKGLLIKELEPCMSRKALGTAPKEKNPDNQVGYVKSLYFAYIFMKSRGLFSRLRYSGAETYNQKTLLSRVEPADDKIEARQEAGAKLKSSRKRNDISKSTYNSLKRAGLKTKESEELRVRTTKKTKVVKNKASNVRRTKSTKKF